MELLGLSAGDWILVASATENLAADIVSRGNIPINIVLGGLRLRTFDTWKGLDTRRMAEQISKVAMDCNTMSPVNWRCPTHAWLSGPGDWDVGKCGC